MSDENKALEIKALQLALEARDADALSEVAEKLHPADIALLYEDLNEEEREFLSSSLGTKTFSDVIPELPDTLIEETLERFTTAEQSDILDRTSDDDRADMLQDVSDEARQRYLSLLEPDDEEVTRSLMRYGEETAGGRMTTQIGRVHIDMNVKQAIEELRSIQEDTKTLSRIFVVNDQGTLMGKVRLRDLAFNKWDTMITDIMEEEAHTVLATADQEEASQMMSKYDMLLLPVVNEQNHLLGVITFDDAMEILEEESTEDIEKMSGISGEQSEESYLNTATMLQFKRRSPWLISLAMLALVSGYVLTNFEALLQALPILFLFQPMVVAAGGNTGGQAATMVVRAISLGEIGKNSKRAVLAKETMLGLLLGLALGLTMYAFCIIILPMLPMFGPSEFNGIGYHELGFAVAIAIIVQLTTATTAGALLPIAARAIKLDPAIVASPCIAALVDISGMLIYFSTAKALLGL
ncbi:magnesium transporter [Persicirhabdus sediminis]|uniref:Magnesium transporter MgtE n=1 Tax=Persicirhabdus sediminis TaxID=454144 RepID=A0A8J7MD69_9BACT|nr:magnesium transporter [Persicirhabdus sediminis]MBK1790441.1 magnesium transporter [Persicirhabdus sediminis]